MRVRADAWATGDLEVIRSLGYADRDGACKSAMHSSAAITTYLADRDAEQRMRRLWLEAADHALANHTTSFAMLTLKDILAGDGLLAALLAKGYTVEAPE